MAQNLVVLRRCVIMRTIQDPLCSLGLGRRCGMFVFYLIFLFFIQSPSPPSLPSGLLLLPLPPLPIAISIAVPLGGGHP
jgi:hypothetical protein